MIPKHRQRAETALRARGLRLTEPRRVVLDVVRAITEPASRVLRGRVAAQSGFRVTHHRIEFYGRCSECQHRADGRARGRRPSP